MDKLTEGIFIKEVDSDIKMPPDYEKYLGGIIKKYGERYFFHRKNQRYTEVIAGLGDNYHLAMDGDILHHLDDIDAEYIFIETQYNIWEISLYHFIINMDDNPGTNGIYTCSLNQFCKHIKKERNEERKTNNTESNERDNVKNGDGKNNINSRSYKDSKRTKEIADRVSKKAKENGKKAKKEDPIGKRVDGKKGIGNKLYKEGEQTTLF